MTLKPSNLLKVLVLGLVLTYAQAFYGQSVDFTLSKNSQDRVSKEKKKSDILGLTFKMHFENAVTLAESKNLLFLRCNFFFHNVLRQRWNFPM